MKFAIGKSKEMPKILKDLKKKGFLPNHTNVVATGGFYFIIWCFFFFNVIIWVGKFLCEIKMSVFSFYETCVVCFTIMVSKSGHFGAMREVENNVLKYN